MAKQCISELREGYPVDSLFSVKYKKPVFDYKGKPGGWFTLGLADRSGEMELKYWGGTKKESTESIHASINEDDVVKVVGTVRKSLDKLEIHVSEEFGKLEKSDNYNLTDFIPVSKRDINDMMSELRAHIENIKNSHIKDLLKAFFDDKTFADEFSKAPGGIEKHHAYVGGLLEHTLHVIHICRSFIPIHPSLDEDLLIAGAILHDIGKIKEYKMGTNIKQTPDGMLRGHITIGQEMLIERMGRIHGFPENLKLKIAHIMLSHHGNGECGSPVVPSFAEAEAVHYADECDARLDMHITTKEDPRTEDFRVPSRKLGRPVYLK